MDTVETLFCDRLGVIRQSARGKGVATCGDCPSLRSASGGCSFTTRTGIYSGGRREHEVGLPTLPEWLHDAGGGGCGDGRTHETRESLYAMTPLGKRGPANLE